MNRRARLCAALLLAAGAVGAPAAGRTGAPRAGLKGAAGVGAAQRADTRAPDIVLMSPQQDRTVVNEQQFTVKVMALSLTGRMEIKVTVANSQGVSAKTIPAAQKEIVRHEVTLAPGDNTLTVVASNEQASSKPLVRTLVYVPGERRQDDLVYLGIGISRYRQTGLSPSFADVDAEELARLFKQQEGGRAFDRVEPKVLKNEAATRAGIIEGLQWLADKADEPEDVALLFISGHIGRGPSGQYYLLTYNHRGESDPEIHDLAFHEIMEMLSEVRGQVLLLIDGRARRSGKELVTLSYAFEADDKRRALVCFGSAEAGPAGAEETAWGHSAFTKALIDGLGGACDAPPKDGTVDTRELGICLSGLAANLTKDRQRPTCLAAPAGTGPVSLFSYRQPK